MKQYIWKQNAGGLIKTTAAYQNGEIISIHGAMGSQPLYMIGDVINYMDKPYKIIRLGEIDVLNIPKDEDILGYLTPLDVKDMFETETYHFKTITANDRYAAWVLELESYTETIGETDIQVWFDDVYEVGPVILMRKKKHNDTFTGTSVSKMTDKDLKLFISALVDEQERRDLSHMCPDCGFAPMEYINNGWQCEACGGEFDE